MRLFEPKTTIYYGESAEELKKITAALDQAKVVYKCKPRGAGTEIWVKRSAADEGEYIVRDAKSARPTGTAYKDL